MATPTRLPVLLQRRKSASAGCAEQASNAVPAAKRTMRLRESGRDEAIIDSARISADCLQAVNDNGAKVVHVGEGGAGFDEVPERREECGRVVVGKKGGRIDAKGPGSADRLAVEHGARRIGRAARAAVGAVGVA